MTIEPEKKDVDPIEGNEGMKPEVESFFGDPDRVHPALARRQRLQELEKQFRYVPVKVGTEQSGSIESIREKALHLAGLIEERAPEGMAKRRAIAYVLEAQMWASHAIAHR